MTSSFELDNLQLKLTFLAVNCVEFRKWTGKIHKREKDTLNFMYGYDFYNPNHVDELSDP